MTLYDLIKFWDDNKIDKNKEIIFDINAYSKGGAYGCHGCGFLKALTEDMIDKYDKDIIKINIED
jgi:hypothetical protein